MRTPASPPPPVSDEQIIRTFTFITIAFCSALVLISALCVFVVVPHGSVRSRGVLIGVALGLVSWFGSRWITSSALDRAARPGLTDKGVAAPLGVAVFRGIAVAEAPALVGFLLAVADGVDVGPLVIAVPVGIVAIVLNASGPAAIRRHLAQLRT
ncbi:MAG TPA: hypothetical protein VFW79_04680 [Cellulomonas sp.]|uniref:hypothetical protein n=1 Tax=Cellulomonas sp. TaxID=40001 RepID=UPI002E33201B|nr:hypothetical protein [Cellulomonas sp.]HEX5331919.1 hypothetical protein [Cellulomonas sp.]